MKTKPQLFVLKLFDKGSMMNTNFEFKLDLYGNKFLTLLNVLHKSMELIEKLYPYRISPNNDIWVEHFTNCREQGFCISNIDHCVSFARHSSSDAIIVYFGQRILFEWGHNTPTTESTWSGNFFNHDDIDGAADFIAKFMVDSMLNVYAKNQEFANQSKGA